MDRWLVATHILTSCQPRPTNEVPCILKVTWNLIKKSACLMSTGQVLKAIGSMTVAESPQCWWVPSWAPLGPLLPRSSTCQKKCMCSCDRLTTISKRKPPNWASQSTSATLLSGSWAHLPMKTAPSEANLVSALAPKAFGRKTLVRFPKVPHCTGKDLESLHLVQPDQAACYDVFKTWSQTQNFGMPSFNRYSHCRTSIGSKRFRVGYSCTVQNQVYTTGTVVVPLGPAMYLSKFIQYFLEWLWITIRSETNPKKQ